MASTKKNCLGKKGTSIFGPAQEEPAPKPKQERPAQHEKSEEKQTSGRGRPTLHEENWSKVTVVLLDRQILFLDQLALEIRKKTGSVVKRAEIIRALVDSLETSNLDIDQCGSEKELKQYFTEQLQN